MDSPAFFPLTVVLSVLVELLINCLSFLLTNKHRGVSKRVLYFNTVRLLVLCYRKLIAGKLKLFKLNMKLEISPT